MESPSMLNRLSPASYGRFLLFIAGMGGLLYGVDVGIVAAALLYLDKTINLTIAQTSLIAAAVFGGSMASSLVAGVLADWLGRKTLMILSGLLFVLSILLIFVSLNFAVLFTGRLLQGVSGGFIAVVVPLYLAECLSAKTRGRGSAVFQLFLTIGIAAAAAVGWYFTNNADAAIAAAQGNTDLIRVAQNHAWRGMFLSVVYPGLVFFVGSFFLSESPRWLFRKGHADAALRALRRSSSEEEAQLQMREMEQTAAAIPAAAKAAGSLLQRKYVVPFVMACVILACNQTTGINSILSYLVIILKQAGLSAGHATQGDFVVKALNVVMTLVAVALVDRKGRKFLLVLGTSGVIVALGTAAVVFHTFEKKRDDVKQAVVGKVRGDELFIPLSPNCPMLSGASKVAGPMVLNVLYDYGSGEKSATVLSTDEDPVMHIAPEGSEVGKPLVIKAATYGPVPSVATGWMIAGCLALFIAAFAVGPGVVVWLALSELMPTRIRSSGMGIALLINQGVSTLIAGLFLPVVSNYGYATMFGFWTLCTVVYFITAAFFLPETKGKTLEEIELGFAKAK
jgi:MFS family permease